MQVEKKTVSTTRGTKEYLTKNEIPQLFECLMTGLMYHRPLDHILYLQECLEKIKKHGVNGLRWDMFLEGKKIPLPPIDSAPREDFRPQPLPEIGNLQLRISLHASIVIIQAGPGIDKGAICKRICSHNPSYIHIPVGSLLRQRALLEAENSESRWRNITDLINGGELAPEDFATETLIKELNKYKDSENFLIEGYPRTGRERQDFERFIGFNRVKFMLLIDCEEDICQKYLLSRPPLPDWCDHRIPAVNKRILSYKMNTLAVCKYFDDQKKLRLVEGDQIWDLVLKDINHIFTKELNAPFLPEPPVLPKDKSSQEPVVSPGRKPVDEIAQLSGIAPEGDRNSELPQCRFVILLGGPGAGKSELIERVCSQHPLWAHVDINEILRRRVIDIETPEESLATCEHNRPFVENWNISITALKDAIKGVPPETEVVIIEGFPQNAIQLNQFNNEIGRADTVVLLDSEENVMRARLAERYCRTKKIEDNETYSDLRILHFKNNGLSICRYYDERCRLYIVPGDGDILEIAVDFQKVLSQPPMIISDNREKTLPSNRIVDDEISNAAAIRIQASVRGHLARKHLNKNPVNGENNNAVIHEFSESENLDNKDSEDVNRELGETLEIDQSKNGEGIVIKEETILEKNYISYNGQPNAFDDDLDDPIVSVIEDKLGKNEVRTPSQMELSNTHVVLLLGGPGSGKKTLGSHIVSKFAVPFIHVDQIINDAIEMKSDGYEELEKYVANEECDETPIYTLIRKWLMDSVMENKVVFMAGFPRTVEHYRRFNTDVCRVSATIFLDVDEDTLKNRLAAMSGPELPLSYIAQLDSFKENNPSLLSELEDSELFSRVNATDGVVEVLQQVTDIIENFRFMKADE